jgi:hypothetical protein
MQDGKVDVTWRTGPTEEHLGRGTPSTYWDLEHYLTKRRKEIDRKYDYRYSQLTQVFGRLLHEKRLREGELRGLREDKLKSIRSFAKFLAEDAA